MGRLCLPGGCTCRGVYLPRGVFLPGGVPAYEGGLPAQQGVYLPGEGVYLSGRCLPAWGQVHPTIDRILDTRFWKYYLTPTLLWAVTSMPSSRMCTACLLPVSPSMHCSGVGVCSRGCLVLGGLLQGGISQHALRQTPCEHCEQNDWQTGVKT